MADVFKEILKESGLPLEEGQIRQEFEQLTQEHELVTNTSKMSPFWRLITAIAVKPVKWLIDALIDEVLPNVFLKTARGAYLQLLAWGVGLDFKDATKAEGEIHFYRVSGVGTLTIKAGTVVQSERLSDEIYRMIVQEDTAFNEGETVKKVRVLAENPGKNYNLANGYYRILPEPINGITHVENLEDWLISPGADRETDDDLRARVRNEFSNVGQHHIDSVYKGMIAKIAGISVDRVYFKHDAPRGPGTANAYLLLDTGVTSKPFIDRVNQHIAQGYHGHGDDLICYAMPETQHNVRLTVYFFKNLVLSPEKEREILQSIQNMIHCAFRGNNDFKVTKIEPFSRFSWSRLGEEIHQHFPQVQSLEWGQSDIISDLNIPRIRQLTVTKGG